MFRSIQPALVVGLALLTASQVGQATSAIDGARTHVASVVVNYSDLDLGRETDAAVLLDRLNVAAYEACGGDPRWNSKYKLMPDTVKRVYKECRADAIVRAVRDVNSPILSRVFANGRQTQLAAK